MTLGRARAVVARRCDRVALALASLSTACGPDTATCEDDTEAIACLGDGACLGGAHVVGTSVAALHLVSADLDGDEQIDVLAVGTREDGTVAAELHRGHGDGTFAGPVASAAVGCSAYPLDGDLDGDRIADLIYPDCDGSLLVFWGSADGPLADATPLALPFLMTGSSVADMDADGISDLVMVGRTAASDVGTLGWVKGSATRELALVASNELAALTFLPTAVRSGDANGDGTPDAFAYARGVADLGIAAGESGGFAAAQPAPVGARVGQLALGAFASASAAIDVLVASPDDMRLVVGELGAAGPAVVATSVFPYRPAHATAVEWDGEPGDEAILADGFDPEVRWFRFAADGSAHEGERVSTPHAAQLVLVPDLDGDDTPDLLVAHFAQAAFSVRLSSEGAP